MAISVPLPGGARGGGSIQVVLSAHLIDPSPEALIAFLRGELREPGRLLQVAGEMEIVYHGRAASTADAGDYLMLLKADGSLQVHAPQGLKPRNWQPRVDDLTLDLDDGQAVLMARRETPREVVRIVFLETAVALALVPRNDGSLTLHGSEAQMRRALARNPGLIERGLHVLDEELPTGVGGVDLFARDERGRLVVVELKRGKATHEAVHQLERYVSRVREETGAQVRGILAAPEITVPARSRLAERALEYREVTALWPEADDEVHQPSLFDA